MADLMNEVVNNEEVTDVMENVTENAKLTGKDLGILGLGTLAIVGITLGVKKIVDVTKAKKTAAGDEEPKKDVFSKKRVPVTEEDEDLDEYDEDIDVEDEQ